MTRISFYVLGNADPQARYQLICKLAEKAIGVGQKVHIHGDEDAELEALSRELWRFRPLSFVAHRVLPTDYLAGSDDDDPVLLSTGTPPVDRNLLINLAKEVPPFFSRFERTLEVFNEQTEVQIAGRKRYRFYQQRGYPLQHHKM